jgi:hypothetical protein
MTRRIIRRGFEGAAPSPLVGEGWGEGYSERSTLSLALPHQGGGDRSFKF